MSGDRDRAPTRCPDCNAVIGRDPLIGWWLCDDCTLAIDSRGRRLG